MTGGPGDTPQSWDSLRVQYAHQLATLAATSEPLPAALEAFRTLIDADRVVLEVRSPRLRFERPENQPAPTGQVATVELLARDRWLGTISAWWGRPARSASDVDAAAQLLVPLLLLEESRHSTAAAREEGSGQLAEHELFVAMIVDSLPLGLYVVDRDYRIRLWSRGREEGMQGVAREEALGRSIFDVLHRLPAEKLKSELDHVIASGEIVRFEAESTASGEPRSYRLSRIPMRLHGGDVTHVIAIGEDITDWKQAQLRSMRAEKLAAVGQLAAGVMHEVNNPLATIGACAETLTAEFAEGATPDPGSVRQLAGIIEHEVHRCRQLADDLLGFSRQGGGERFPLDAEQLMDETFTLLSHHSRFKRARVKRARPVNPVPPILGNREQLMQVLMALLLNAVDATVGGGDVVASVEPDEGGGAALVVSDTGSGIPSADLPRIFEPFYTTKPPGQGTGLGLAISYGIITDHGGRIDVESTPGHGSTFRIVLPPWREEDEG